MFAVRLYPYILVFQLELPYWIVLKDVAKDCSFLLRERAAVMLPSEEYKESASSRIVSKALKIHLNLLIYTIHSSLHSIITFFHRLSFTIVLLSAVH